MKRIILNFGAINKSNGSTFINIVKWNWNWIQDLFQKLFQIHFLTTFQHRFGNKGILEFARVFFFKPRIKRSLHFLHVPTGLSLSDDEIPNFSKPNCPIGENNDLESVTRSVWTEIAARKVNSFSQLPYRYPCSCGFSLQFDKISYLYRTF